MKCPFPGPTATGCCCCFTNLISVGGPGLLKTSARDTTARCKLFVFIIHRKLLKIGRLCSKSMGCCCRLYSVHGGVEAALLRKTKAQKWCTKMASPNEEFQLNSIRHLLTYLLCLTLSTTRQVDRSYRATYHDHRRYRDGHGSGRPAGRVGSKYLKCIMWIFQFFCGVYRVSARNCNEKVLH